MGLANAPSSRARSCRIGWTRMTLPSRDSCTDPATIETSMAWRAQRRPALSGRYLSFAEREEVAILRGSPWDTGDPHTRPGPG